MINKIKITLLTILIWTAALHVHIPNITARTGEPVLIWDDANNRFINIEVLRMIYSAVRDRN
jgi:hypothetical protein